jgi:hypothetical protein
MCGLLQGSAHWTHAANSSQKVRRQRLLLVARANKLLRLFRLHLSDFQGQSYLLAGPSGTTMLIDDFGALWMAAEQMIGRPIDPLDIPWPTTRAVS